MKRKVVLLTAFALVALLVAGGTMAWFTAEADPVTNTFQTGNVRITIEEEFDGPMTNVYPGQCKDKKVRVKNISQTTDVYVRVKLIPAWEGGLDTDLVVDLDEEKATVYGIGNVQPLEAFKGPGGPGGPGGKKSKWVDGGDGWYYYKEKVKSGEPTNNLIKKVCFDGDSIGNDYQDGEFTLTIEAEAVQGVRDAALYEWGLEKLPWEK